jgi:chromosomal replication initiation ATPase DnaA
MNFICPKWKLRERVLNIFERVELPESLQEQLSSKFEIYQHVYKNIDVLILVYEENAYLEVILKGKFLELKILAENEMAKSYEFLLLRKRVNQHLPSEKQTALDQIPSEKLDLMCAQGLADVLKKNQSEEQSEKHLIPNSLSSSKIKESAFLKSEGIKRQTKFLENWIKQNPMDVEKGFFYFVEAKDFDDQKTLLDYFYRIAHEEWKGLELLKFNARDLVKRFISSLRTGRIDAFVNYFESCRLLIIEEADVFKGKMFCQEKLWEVMRLIREKTKGSVVLGVNAQQACLKFEFEPLKRLLQSAKQISTVQISDVERCQMLNAYAQLQGKDLSMDALKIHTLKHPYTNYQRFLGTFDQFNSCLSTSQPQIASQSNHLDVSFDAWLDAQIARHELPRCSQHKLKTYLSALIYKFYYHFTFRQMATLMHRNSHSGLAYITNQAQKKLRESSDFKMLYQNILSDLKIESHSISLAL